MKKILAIGVVVFIFKLSLYANSQTQWWEVDPTQTVENVIANAGFLSRAEFVSASNNFDQVLQNAQMYIDAIAAMSASNTVDAMLTPSPLTLKYGEDFTNQYVIAKSWVTQPLKFDRQDGQTNMVDGSSWNILNDGRLRNYSVVLEGIPNDMSYPLFMDFHRLTNENSKVYANPSLEVLQNGLYGWEIISNDIPYMVTLREPESKVVILQRTKLSQND